MLAAALAAALSVILPAQVAPGTADPAAGREPRLTLAMPSLTALDAPGAQRGAATGGGAFALRSTRARAAADDEDDGDGEGERVPRLSFTAWGGEVFSTGALAQSGPGAGLEIAYAFDPVQVGVLGQAYHLRATPTRAWSPVVLLRLTERFDTHRGFEAGFTFGVGAGETNHWMVWYQIALGVRVALGPALFLAGEVGFEQYDLVRLVGGIGVRL